MQIRREMRLGVRAPPQLPPDPRKNPRLPAATSTRATEIGPSRPCSPNRALIALSRMPAFAAERLGIIDFPHGQPSGFHLVFNEVGGESVFYTTKPFFFCPC